MNRRFTETLLNYVNGTDKSVGARAFRSALTVVSFPYSCVVRLRNYLYDIGVKPQIYVERPTVSVGNLTLGGVGKTPFVAWLTDYFLSVGQTPGLVSRGYHAKKQKKIFQARASSSDVCANDSNALLNDEAYELAIRLPDTPHYQGSDRVEVATKLLNERSDVDVVLLDDAFQHRRIARDLNVVLLDALNPFGGGRIFPSGFLRESSTGLKRADTILLNRADFLSKEERLQIRRQVEKFAPSACWCEIAQRPGDVFTRSSNGEIIKLDYSSWRQETKSQRFVAFCGLGAPMGFKKTLEKEGIVTTSFLAFPDHYAYAEKDFQSLNEEIVRSGADGLVTTMKDLVKLPQADPFSTPVYSLSVGVHFLSGEDDFCELCQKALRRRRL